MFAQRLVLIASKSQTQTERIVKSIVYRTIDDTDVTHVWIDPEETRRAVALIDVHPSENDLVYHVSDQQSRVLAWTEPATSLLVKTNGVFSFSFGAKDKLKMLFTIKKRGGNPVKFVQTFLDYYEIGFENGWDAVKRACDMTWSIGGEDLTVLPLFPCFKEDLEFQILELEDSEKCILPPQVSDSRMADENREEDSQHKTSVSQMENNQFGEDEQFPLMLGDTNEYDFEATEKSKIDMESSHGSQNQDSNIIKRVPKPKPRSRAKCTDQTLALPENNDRFNKISFLPMDTARYNDVEKESYIYHAERQGEQPTQCNLTRSSSTLDRIMRREETSDSLSSLLIKNEEIIQCNKLFLGWLLSEMEFASNSEIIVNFDRDNMVLLFQSEDEKKDAWHAAIEEECRHGLQMSRYEETFLMQMNSIITIGLSGYKLVLNTDLGRPKLFVIEAKNMTEDSRNDQIPVQTWISSLVEQKFFSDIPEEWLEDDSAYREVKKLYSPVKIVICKADRRMVLLTLSWQEAKESLTSAARDINNLLILSRKSKKPASNTQSCNWNNKGTGTGFTQDVQTHVDQTFVLIENNDRSNKITSPPMNTEKESYIDHAERQGEQPTQRNLTRSSSKLGGIMRREETSDSLSSLLIKNEGKIQCNNLFLGWLLSEMEFASNSKIIVNFDRDNMVLLFRSEDEKKDAWHAAIEQECRHGPQMLDYEENFLMKMSSIIKSELSRFKLALRIDQEIPQLLVTEPKNTDSNNGQMSVQAWITSQIEQKSFSDIPEDWFEDDSAYREVQNIHSCVKIVVCEAERKMVLLTLSWEDALKSLSEAEHDINMLLNLWKKKPNQPNKKKQPDIFQSQGGDTISQTIDSLYENEDMSDRESAEQPTNRFVQWPHNYIKFCQQFLKEQIKDIESKHPSLEIQIIDSGFKIQNAYRINEVEHDLSSLKRQIKCSNETFVIPGLLPFLKKEGEYILKEISTRFGCLVYFPVHGQGAHSGSLEMLELTSTCYNGTLLGTAIYGQKRIHLIQGKLTDVDLDMIVDVRTSSDVHEAKLTKGQSGERLFLLLPEWSSPNGFDCHKLFSQQRDRLQTELHLLFAQAAHCNSKKIVMSTSGMRENNCANFPVEDFTEAFRIALQFAETHNTLDVYICETASPLVFKTFEYIFAHAFRTSKEKDWEVIASEETSSVPDYTSLHKTRQISVNIVTQSWLNFLPDEIICLPVIFKTEQMSVPYVNPDDRGLIEKSIFQRFPDGLLPGQAEFVSLPRKKFLIYNCLPWGFDAEKILDVAMTNCFHKGAEETYSKFRFIPPLGYPEHFVAKKVFQHLDKMIPTLKRYSQITILLENESQKKPFEELLKKRNPEQKGLLQSLYSFFLPEKKDTKASDGKTFIVKNQTEKTQLGFLALSENHSHQASQFLFRELSFLIEANTQEFKLNPEMIQEHSDFETMVKSATWMSTRLCTSFGKKKGKKRKKKPQVPLSMHLTLSALALDKVHEFIHRLQVLFGTKIFKTEQPIDGGNNGGKILKKAESYGSLKNEAERSNSFGPNGGEQYIDDESDPRESENATKDDKMESSSENLLMPSTMSDFNEEKQIDGHHGNHQNKHSQIESTISRMDEDSTAESEENIPDVSIKTLSSSDLSSFRTNLQENQDSEGAKKVNNDDTMEWKDNITQATNTIGSQGFLWLYKSNNDSVFLSCDSALNNDLEKAYSDGTFGMKKIGSSHVDLDRMVVEDIDGEKLLIRVETFDASSMDAVVCPEHWCKQNFRILQVGDKGLSGELQNCLKGLTCEILKIEALENPFLYKKYRCKQKQTPGCKDVILWHRISVKSKLFACQYGLHYNFMEIPSENYHKDRPVCWFFEDPQHCFSTHDIQEETTVCIVKAVVQLQSQARYQKYHTISSDAEAYPMNLFTLKVKKQ